MPGYWLILRVLTGHPFRVETCVQGLGIDAYCPKHVVHRRHQYDRSRTLDCRRPLFPGYVFASRAFDVLRINRSAIRTRLMARDGRYLLVTPTEMARIRDAELSADDTWKTSIEEIVQALAVSVSTVASRRYVNLGELQSQQRVAK